MIFCLCQYVWSPSSRAWGATAAMSVSDMPFTDSCEYHLTVICTGMCVLLISSHYTPVYPLLCKNPRGWNSPVDPYIESFNSLVCYCKCRLTVTPSNAAWKRWQLLLTFRRSPFRIWTETPLILTEVSSFRHSVFRGALSFVEETVYDYEQGDISWGSVDTYK